MWISNTIQTASGTARVLAAQVQHGRLLHIPAADDLIEVNKQMAIRTKSLIAVTCIVALCVIAIPAIIAGSDGFLTADTTSQVTVIGCNATYLLTIENTGAETETYNLSTTNIDNISVMVLNPSVITLDSGCSGNVTLNVTDDDIIGPYCVVVNATSRTNAEVTDEIEIITAVVEE